MKYDLLFANFRIYGDVHLLADLAQQAEEAGWSRESTITSIRLPTLKLEQPGLWNLSGECAI